MDKALVAGGAVHVKRGKTTRFGPLILFRAMIASWASQSTPVPLTMSLSADDDILPIVSRDVARLESIHGGLTVLQQPRRISQFEHYAAIAGHWNRNGVAPSSYVLFTDGDDLWHPHRVREYTAALHEAESLLPRGKLLTRVICTPYIDEARSQAAPGDFFTSEEVDAAVARQRLRIVTDSLEYWHCATPLKLLACFLAEAPAAVKQNDYADMYFFNFIKSFGSCGAGDIGVSITLSATESPWLYFYRAHGDSTLRDNRAGHARDALCQSPQFFSLRKRFVTRYGQAVSAGAALVAVSTNLIQMLSLGLGFSNAMATEFAMANLPVDDSNVFREFAPLLMNMQQFKDLAWPFASSVRDASWV